MINYKTQNGLKTIKSKPGRSENQVQPHLHYQIAVRKKVIYYIDILDTASKDYIGVMCEIIDYQIYLVQINRQ